MSEKTDGIYNLTAPAIMTFPALYEARKFKANGKESGEPKFGANFTFEANSEDLKNIKQLAGKIARAKWPDRDLKTLKFPFTAGDKLADKRKAAGKDDGEWQRGKVMISARSKFEPRLAVVLNGKVTDLDGDLKMKSKNQFYSGVLCYAQFNFVPYDAVGGNPPGVAAYLNMVFSLNKGERVGGGQSAVEVFKGYQGALSAEDPTSAQTLDDEIPF